MARYFLILLLIACASGEAPPQAPEDVVLASEFRLAPGQARRVASSGLTVRFVRLVSDSRCPAGVSCIWEGDGEVEIGLNLGEKRSLVRLHTHGGAQHTGQIVFSGYRVKLVALNPAPANPPRPESEYVATLVVDR